MKRILVVGVVYGLVGCVSSTQSPEPREPRLTPASRTETTTAVKPDVGKVKAHLKKHVKYPATRAEVLAACADTPEFSDGEKQWISDNLPERLYTNAEQVEAELGILRE